MYAKSAICKGRKQAKSKSEAKVGATLTNIESEPAKAPKPQKGGSGEKGKASGQDISRAPEYGGPKGLEPTRYGDWEKNGIISDF